MIFLGNPGAGQEKQLLQFSTAAGALLLEGFGDGLCLMDAPGIGDKAGYSRLAQPRSGEDIDTPAGPGPEKAEAARSDTDAGLRTEFYNNTAFSILQASRVRISKTEYISCPSCGRTLFDLQETTAKIRAVTHHLKGVKIAIMGCIVNGPGEMADADFGYVGSGVGTITLYKGKEVVKRGVPSAIAVEELINLLKESGVWVTPETPALS